MKPRRSWWLLLGAGAAALIAALAWLTVVLLRLEQAELGARAETEYQGRVRLALWRLDYWLSPQIAREAARPYFEYLAYYPPERAYTRFLNAINPGDVLTASPLLTFRSDHFPVHFQFAPDGTLTSPQVPRGNLRDLAEATACSGGEIDAQQAQLHSVQRLVNPVMLATRAEQAEHPLAALNRLSAARGAPTTLEADTGEQKIAAAEAVAPTVPGGSPPQQRQTRDPWDAQKQQLQQTIVEYTKRAQGSPAQQEANVVQRLTLPDAASAVLADDRQGEQVTLGPLVPIWIDAAPAGPAGAPERQLLFVRRVQTGAGQCLQGFLVDWPRLRTALLDQIRDLFAAPDLEPLAAESSRAFHEGMALATIPAALKPGSQPRPQCDLLTPARLTLGLAWLAIAAAIPAAALTLRSSIAYGEKRSRFASAVTHELRTPLTTFRMYSEMLADGMVTAPRQRQEYLDTLKSSSLRLATLVENVLTYARIEDGRGRPGANLASTTLGALLDRHLPILERRAVEAAMKLVVDSRPAPTTAISVDGEAIGQVLFNLVDNACKYAAGAADRRIHLEVAATGRTLEFVVRDHGPGIAPPHARAIFRPFERGAHKPGDTIPGVGLGLALARGLARDLGGDLVLEERSDEGASFKLTVPLRSA